MTRFSNHGEGFGSHLIQYATGLLMTIVVLAAGALQLVTVFSA
jgi:hypothetical protein